METLFWRVSAPGRFFPPKLIGRRFLKAGNIVQSERGNQRDGLWLARMNLATHYSCSNTVGFWFSFRASSGLFGWIFDWKVREESWILWPLCWEVWKQSDAILAGKIAPAPKPFKTRFPPLSFYYKEQSTANSNSFKIVQKIAFEVKGLETFDETSHSRFSKKFQYKCYQPTKWIFPDIKNW